MVAYMHLMVDAYPPFSMADDPDYPVRLNIDYTERIDNWRPLVQWLLGDPLPDRRRGAVLAHRAADVVAFFTILFTKKIPREIFELMMPGLRWNLRGNAYAYFTTDRYPPWAWG